MVYWRQFKITNRENRSGYIRFHLDGYVSYSDGSKQFIDCSDCSPFNDYHQNNYIEIDTDKARNYGYSKTFSENDIVRRCASIVPFQSSSSSIAPSNFTSAVTDSYRSGEDFQAFVEQYDTSGRIKTHMWVARKDGEFGRGGYSRQ